MFQTLEKKLCGRIFNTDPGAIIAMQDFFKQLPEKELYPFSKIELTDGAVACYLRDGNLKLNKLCFTVNMFYQNFYDSTFMFYEMFLVLYQ